MLDKKIDRYKITSVIGQGAMGVVYRAKDPLLHRIVALKTISVTLSQEEVAHFQKRFFREASSAGRLNHPNIVTVYDAGKSGDTVFMAMEFLEGLELRDILDPNSLLSLDKIGSITAQVADGLAFAHSHGVIHRDIKPSNIMVLKSGIAKITDFGIALIPSASRTMDGKVLGSPKYMSPEQVSGLKLDTRTDIFSLGVVLYEMLTGRPPFTGENMGAIMHRILHEDPPPPSHSNPQLSAEIDRIVTRALAKNPSERYADAAELATDLRTAIPGILSATASQPLLATVAQAAAAADEAATIVIARPGRRPRKQRLWVLGGVLALFVAGLVLWLALRGTDNPAPAPEVAEPAQEQAPQAEVVPATEPAPIPVSNDLTAPTETIEQPQEAAGEATVDLAVTPWGEVYVDGQQAGLSPPLNTLTLPSGSHTIEIRNGDLPPYSETMELKAGESRKIRHKFG